MSLLFHYFFSIWDQFDTKKVLVENSLKMRLGGSIKYVAFCAIFGHQRIEIPISRTRFQYKCFLAQTLIQPYEMKILRKLLPSEALWGVPIGTVGILIAILKHPIQINNDVFLCML